MECHFLPLIPIKCPLSNMRNQGCIKALLRANERMGMKGNMENAADCVLVEPDRDWRRGREVGVGKKSLQWGTSLHLPHYGHHLTLNPGQGQRRRPSSSWNFP